MIELRTGLPGNGKTLSMIQELAAMLRKWDKPTQGEKGEARPVFVHNVKDLILPHEPFPVIESKNERTGGIKRIPDWAKVPDGSLCIIDECQDLFPPRSSQSEAPPHVAWLNTHRHRGVDLVLITQHPKLIDSSVRALVGKHKHYRRVFGMNRSLVYEWDGCSDSLSGLKNAVTSQWAFPKDAFKWYKSAEVHTKQKFKLPLWLGIPFLGIGMLLYFGPKAYSAIRTGRVSESKPSAHGSGQPQAAAAVGRAKGGAIAPTAVASPVPPMPPIKTDPKYVGCIASASRCKCITDAGEVVDDPPQCRESAEHVGVLVAMASQSPAAVPAAASASGIPAAPAPRSSPPASAPSGSPPPVSDSRSTFGTGITWTH